MAAGVSDDQRLSVRLAKWMKETMVLESTKHTDTSLLAASFSLYCKGSSMLSLWETMISRVHPVKQADDIRKNVELHKTHLKNEELEKDVEEKKRKYTALRSELDLLKLQSESKKRELQNMNLEVKKLKNEKQMNLMKSVLYKKDMDSIIQLDASFKEYLDWIMELIDTYNKDPLSTSKKNSVKSACDLVKDGLGGSDHKMLFQLAGCLARKYTPHIIIAALMRISEKSTDSILDSVKKFHINDELVSIREYMKHHKPACCVDGMDTLKDALQQWDCDCLKYYSKRLDVERNCCMKMEQAKTIREKIVESLQQKYEFEPTSLQHAIDELDSEAELMAAKSCIQTCKILITHLEDEIEEKTKSKEEVIKAKKKIRNLAAIIRDDQERIMTMSQQNLAITSKLTSRQKKIHGVGQEEVCSKADDLEQACKKAESSMEAQLSALNHVDMKKMHTVKVNGSSIPVKDLSIYRYNDISADKGGFSYSQCLQNLGLHAHVPPSTALQKIIDTKKEIASLEKMESSFTALHVDNLVETLKDMRKKCTDSDARALQNLESQSEERKRVVETAQKHCSDLEKAIKVWYEMPAQYQAPWITRNGLTFEQWKAKNST